MVYIYNTYNINKSTNYKLVIIFENIKFFFFRIYIIIINLYYYTIQYYKKLL